MPLEPRPSSPAYPKLVDAILPAIVRAAGGDPTDLEDSLANLRQTPGFAWSIDTEVKKLGHAIRDQSNGHLREDLIIRAAISLLANFSNVTFAHISVLRTILPTCAIEGRRSKPENQKARLEFALETAFKSALDADRSPNSDDTKSVCWDRSRPQWRTIVILGCMLLELADTPQDAIKIGTRLYGHIIKRYGAGLKASTFDWMQFRVQSDAVRAAILASKSVKNITEAHVHGLIANDRTPFGAIVEACHLFGEVRATACEDLLRRAGAVVKKISSSHQPAGATEKRKSKLYSSEILAIRNHSALFLI
jgi:hypothetical protein